MKLTIRTANGSDAEAISSLVTHWAHFYLEDPSLPEAVEFLASLGPAPTAERIKAGSWIYHVAVDASGVCGVIAIRDSFHLYNLFVRADLHGKGIARSLWERGKSHSGSAHFIVNATLPAVPVYEAFGFVATGAARTAKGLTYVPMEYLLS